MPCNFLLTLKITRVFFFFFNFPPFMIKAGFKLPVLRNSLAAASRAVGPPGTCLARAVLVINMQYGNWRAVLHGIPSGWMCTYMHMCIYIYTASILNKMCGTMCAHVCEHDNMCEREQNMFNSNESPPPAGLICHFTPINVLPDCWDGSQQSFRKTYLGLCMWTGGHHASTWLSLANPKIGTWTAPLN